MRRIWIRCCLIAAGALAALLLGEVCIRVFRPWYIPDYSQTAWYRPAGLPGVPYLLKANLRASWGLGLIESNELGLRDTHPLEKAKEIFRVVVLGDSVAFGVGVGQNETFPILLERLLNNGKPGRYEVINAGIPGFSVNDEAALLPFIVEWYKPDLVLWLLMLNDYDDSFGVSEKGLISFTDVDYVVNEQSLPAWGHRGRFIDVEDFRNSMSPESLAWAEGRSLPSPSFGGGLAAWSRSHLRIFAWAEKGYRSFLGRKISREPNRVIYQDAYKTPAGRDYKFFPFAPIFSSRRAIARANDAIASVNVLATSRSLPVILLNACLPMDRRWRKPESPLRYEELSSYLGEPFYEFWFNHNLKWDPHLNPSGHLRVAEALRKLLVCLGYFGVGQACERDAEIEEDMKQYWKAFESGRRQFIANYYGAIDLDNYRGIHQILGGLFPPRTFPGPLARRANFLLPANRGETARVSGTLSGSQGMALTISAYGEQWSRTKTFHLDPGEVDFSMPLPGLKNSQQKRPETIEIELKCETLECPRMRLHKVELQ